MRFKAGNYVSPLFVCSFKHEFVSREHQKNLL
jgi:hypothetical protein